jgi:hypothetical protein
VQLCDPDLQLCKGKEVAAARTYLEHDWQII